MNQYSEMARVIQSTISLNAFTITKEEAFKNFYKSHGRLKDFRQSRDVLRKLHVVQTQNKKVLKTLQELAYVESLFAAV